jgi:phosphatidylserine/phosphatidylglycerophosphate/cardiolipin synthase-like enzyme
MIIDGSVVVVGSQNWCTEGVDTNRDASVVIKNAAVAALSGTNIPARLE